jgi:O-phospho-L-seryl-tRNASec:L-selenocysteinyl-tRNA synthase
MNENIFQLSQQFVSKTYVEQAQASRRTRERLIESLLSQRRLPEKGWDDVSIELFLHELAAMDSNNFIGI